MREEPIVIVGCGPGSPDYLTPLARRAVERAEVLVGAGRLLALFPGHGGERIPARGDVEAILREIGRRRVRRVAVLVTGDPGLCSLAGPVIRRFGREACEVIPGISSVQVAWSRIGLDWLGARTLDAHEKDPEAEPGSLSTEGKIAVLAGRKGALRWAARLARMLGEGYRTFLCQDLTLPEENVRRINPEELESLEVSSRTVILLVKESLMP